MKIVSRDGEVITRRTLPTFLLDVGTPCIEGRPSDRRGYVGPGHGIYEHRRAYERAKGQIPPGLEIDHLCRNRKCINPDHLEAVSHKENSHRAMSLITHCVNGHAFDEANVYNKRGQRECRTCHRLSERARHHRNRILPSLRQSILSRDGGCLAYVFDNRHVCRDALGRSHGPHALERMTIEHVKTDLRMGVRAPSDPQHMVTLCWAANVGVPSKELRAFLRDYLAGMTRLETA